MRRYLRLLPVALLGSGLTPLVIAVVSGHQWARHGFLLKPGLLALLVVVATLGFRWSLMKCEPWLESDARNQAALLRSLPRSYVPLAIFISAALGLFLELAIIRWQASVFEFFAFYKNFSLLCCFAGLGVGYATANSKQIPLSLSIPLLGWQFAWMLGVRYGMKPGALQSMHVLPFSEQLNMGLGAAKHFYSTPHIYAVLPLTFLLTTLALIPIGQLSGALMDRIERLPAYGFNLLGSLAGVLLMFAASAFWTPPIVWFALAFAAIIAFCLRNRSSLLIALSSSIVALIVLAWPFDPLLQRVYSPYQLLEVGRNERGLMLIRAAGHYYQRVHDLSAANHNVDVDPQLKAVRDYYELPYRMFGQPKTIAIVGAGSGNDVAAALRRGVEHVDAIEIDPAILLLGRAGHPEHPYGDARVHAIVNDARTFLRTTPKHFDMVVYGLLDSHTLLSQASSVRLDSFVYTVEALREARSRLNPNGIISLSFATINPALGRKLYLMTQEAFDGRAPLCIRATYDRAVIFLEAEEKSLVAPPWLAEDGFEDVSSFYGNPDLKADVSTDDWPFFYMPRRIYPMSYLSAVGVLLLLSALLIANFSGDRPHFSQFQFFLLGAGFMLIETKGITELGLTFGNSWQVIGIIIAGLMLMAFLANCAIQWMNSKRVVMAYVLLLASLIVGWGVARSGGLASTWLGRLEAVLVLTAPMFFSGLVFSTLMNRRGETSGILATNLFGAMVGGLLEYNSMYLGFQSLYLMAAFLYAVAFVSELMGERFAPAIAAPVPAK